MLHAVLVFYGLLCVIALERIIYMNKFKIKSIWTLDSALFGPYLFTPFDGHFWSSFMPVILICNALPVYTHPNTNTHLYLNI